ncbi:MAG: phage tail tape measure protein [Planctomycetes bacterium]|nr:phage tail tape measure protein [Planctomycetota bacterium]
MADKVVISFEGADAGGTRVIEAIERSVHQLAQAFRTDLVGSVRSTEAAVRSMSTTFSTQMRQLAVETHVAAQSLGQQLLPAIHAIGTALGTLGAQQAAIWQGMVARQAAAATAIERRSAVMASKVRAAFAALPALGGRGGQMLAQGGDRLGGFLGGIGSTIGGLFGGGVGGGSNPFTGIISGAVGMVNQIVPELVRVAQAATGAVTQVLAAIPNLIGSVLSKIPSGLTQVLGAGWKLFGGFVQGVGGVLQGLVGIAGGVFQAVASVAGTALNGLLTVATRVVGGIADAFGGLVGTVAGIFGKVASTAALGLTAVIGVATFKSVELRSKLASTFALIADDLAAAGPAGAQGIRRAFADVARDTLAEAGNMRWSEVGKAIYETVGSGFRTAAEARPIVQAAAQATLAGGESDPGGMVLALVKALQQFEIPASRAQEVADKFFQTVNYGIITIGQLAEAFPGVGAIARAAGLSMEEALTLVAEGSKRLDLETTSSGLQQFLTAVGAPDEGALKARKALGIPTERLTPEQQKLSEELSASIKKAEGFIDATTRMEKTTKAQRNAVADARKELQRLQEQLEAVRQAGQSVNAIDFLRELRSRDLSLGQLTEVVGGRIQAARFAAAFTGGGAAKEAGARGEGAGLDNFATTLEEIQNRSAGAVARGAAEVKRSLGFNVQQTFTNIGLLWDTIVGRIEERAADAWPKLHSGFDGFRASVEEWVASGQLDEFFNGVAETAGRVFGFLGEQLKGLTWEDFKTGAQDAWAVVSTLAKASWEGAKLAAALATTIMNTDLTGQLGGAWDWVKDKATEVWTAIVGLSQGDTTGFAGIFKKLEGFFLQVLGNVLQVVGQVVDAVVEGAAVAVEKIGGFGAKAFNVLTLGIPAVLGANPVDAVESASRSIRDGKGGIGGLGDELVSRGTQAQSRGEFLSARAAENVPKRAAADARREAEEDAAAESAKRAARNLEGLAESARKADEAQKARAAAERAEAEKLPEGWHASPEAARAAANPEAAPKSKSEQFLDGIEEQSKASNEKLDRLIEIGESESQKTAREAAEKEQKSTDREGAKEDRAMEQELRSRGVKVPKKPGRYAAEGTGELLAALGLSPGALESDPTNPYTMPASDEDPRRARRRKRQNRPNFSQPFSGPNTYDRGMSGSPFGLFSKPPRMVEREVTQKQWWEKTQSSETELRKRASENVRERVDQLRKRYTPLTKAGGPLGQLGDSPGGYSHIGPEVRSFQVEKEELIAEEVKRLKRQEKSGRKGKERRVQSAFTEGWDPTAPDDFEEVESIKANRRRKAKRNEAAARAALGKDGSEGQAPAVAQAAKDGVERAGGLGQPFLVEPPGWKPPAASQAPPQAAPAAPAAQAPPSAEGAKGGVAAALEEAQKARQAVVDELKRQSEQVAELGKELAEADGELLTATKEAGQATTDVLTAHSERLKKVEDELREQARQREALASVSGNGSGV